MAAESLVNRCRFARRCGLPGEHARCGVSLPDDAQAFEREQIVDGCDVFRRGTNQRGEASGSDDLRLLAHFLEQVFEDAVDQAKVSVVKPRLQAADGIGADDAGGLANVDARKSGSSFKECIGGNSNSWTDHSAHVLGLGGNAIEGGGGAEIDNDAGRAILLDGSNRVDDAIGAYFRGVVVEHGHPGLYAGFDEEWL